MMDDDGERYEYREVFLMYGNARVMPDLSSKQSRRDSINSSPVYAIFKCSPYITQM